MSLNVIVRYSFKTPFSPHAIMLIEINETTLEYHLISTMSSSRISVEPTELHMGHVDIGSVSDIQKLKITNVGGKGARSNKQL